MMSFTFVSDCSEAYAWVGNPYSRVAYVFDLKDVDFQIHFFGFQVAPKA
jgi:hypothetical protein